MAHLLQLPHHVPPALRSRHVAPTLLRRQPCLRCPTACHATGTSQVVSPGAAPGLRPEPWTNSPQQQEALQTLARRMTGSPYGCPDEATLQWYLRDRYFDVEEAEQKLRSMLKWRSQFRPADLTAASVARELSSGKAYVHNQTDRYGRPAIIIRTKLHVTGQYPLQDSKRLCTYLLDQAIAALPPGQEQIIGVFDLRGFELRNADILFAEFMIEAFFKYYPRRVAQVLMVDAPWVFKGPWAIVKPLMRKYAALVEFVSVEDLVNSTFTRETAPSDFR